MHKPQHHGATRGFILTVEAILLFTLIVIAVLVALAGVRNALVESNIVLRDVRVFDSTSPRPQMLGRTVGFDDAQTPQVLRRDPNSSRFVLLGVRPDRFTSRDPVFYTMDGCAGTPFVYGAGFTSGENIGYFHRTQGTTFAVGAGGTGLLFEGDGSPPCGGVGCPIIASVYRSDWTFDDAEEGDPAPLDPCRDVIDEPVTGIVPAFEVVDPDSGANALQRFIPPFVAG